MGNNMFVASINNNTVTLSCDYIDTQKTKKAFTDSALSQYQTYLNTDGYYLLTINVKKIISKLTDLTNAIKQNNPDTILPTMINLYLLGMILNIQNIGFPMIGQLSASPTPNSIMPDTYVFIIPKTLFLSDKKFLFTDILRNQNNHSFIIDKSNDNELLLNTIIEITCKIETPIKFMNLVTFLISQFNEMVSILILQSITDKSGATEQEKASNKTYRNSISNGLIFSKFNTFTMISEHNDQRICDIIKQTDFISMSPDPCLNIQTVNQTVNQTINQPINQQCLNPQTINSQTSPDKYPFFGIICCLCCIICCLLYFIMFKKK